MEEATEAEKEEIGRRIKAARAYAGITSAQGLAAKIDDAGFRRDAIAKWESGNYSQRLGHNKLKALANACDLSVNFFYWDFRALSELDEDEQKTLARRRLNSEKPSEGKEPGSQTGPGA